VKPIKVMRAASGGGGGGLAAVVPAGTYFKDIPTGTANVGITFANTGNWSATDDDLSTGTWKTGTGVVGDYAIRWTTTAGALTTGTSGSWFPLSSSITYGIFQTGSGNNVCTGTVEIRRVVDSVVIAAGVISLNATVT